MTSLAFVQCWSRHQYLVLKSMDMYKIDYIKDFWYFCGNLLQLIVFTCQFIFEPRFHDEPYRSKNSPPIAPAGAGYKIADNIVCVP